MADGEEGIDNLYGLHQNGEMTKHQFSRWLKFMRISATEAAKMLGVSLNTITRYKKRGGNTVLALACFALLDCEVGRRQRADSLATRKHIAALKRKRASETAKHDAEKRERELRDLDAYNKAVNIPPYALRLHLDGYPIEDIAAMLGTTADAAAIMIEQLQKDGVEPWDYGRWNGGVVPSAPGQPRPRAKKGDA